MDAGASPLSRLSTVPGYRGGCTAAQAGLVQLAMETVGNRVAVALYVLAMVAVVVGVDVLFFRHHFWDRLMVNVGIVLVFAAFYLRFLKRP